jgi:antitoxin component YwqK of YwqJK toxin-antitoxin module
MKEFRREIIRDIFTKLGEDFFTIWLSGKKKEGECKRWYANGQFWEHSFWKNNKRHGEFKEWWDNGQIVEHSFWKNGECHGEYKIWHPNGQIKEHSFYKNDEKVRDMK